MTKAQLENSLDWQLYVIKNSRNPVQVARCNRAAERLKAQIAYIDLNVNGKLVLNLT